MLGEYSVYSVKIQKFRKDDTTVLYDQEYFIKVLSDLNTVSPDSISLKPKYFL